MSERRPDLVLLDVMMPVLDGRETSRRMQAEETLNRIPIVFFTAAPAALDLREHPQATVLPKPVDLATLLDTVAALTS
jgi:CheY-like chemotaxis protein